MRNYQVVRKRVRGGSFKSFLRGARDFLKRHNVISKLASGYSAMGLPYAGLVGAAGGVAKSHGYGKRKPRRAYGMGLKTSGAGLRRSGGALRRAGTRRGCGLTMA